MRKEERTTRRSELALAAARHRARGALGLFVAASACYAAAELALEFAIAPLLGGEGDLLAVVSLVVTAAFLAMLVVSEVRSWRLVTRSCRERPSGADGFILGAALWFGGAAPLALVNSVRHLMGGELAGDATMAFLQVGVAVVFLALALLRFAPEVWGR